MSVRRGGDGETPAWLASAGFRFNPFSYLEASADPHLGDYLVDHAGIAVAWDNVPAIVWAPAGGGKTAMRIYTARTCWTALGSHHPFPIVHQPNASTFAALKGDLEDHLGQLARTGAETLLLALAQRPERLLELEGSRQQQVVNLLKATLPAPYPRYVNILNEAASASPLVAIIDRSFPVLDPPDPVSFGELCRLLSAAANESAPRLLSGRDQFEALAGVLLGDLGYRSLFLLIDAVDGLPETVGNNQAAERWLAPLLHQAPAWAARNIFVKGFLPAEMASALDGLPPLAAGHLRFARIAWTPPLLAQVIRYRVYVAADGAFGSLDAISSPALRDVETQLARAVQPLPRKLIWLIDQLLNLAAERSASDSLRIEDEDVTRALALYAARTRLAPA